MAVGGLSLHPGSSESRKTLEQKFISKSALWIPIHSTNLFLFSCHHIPTNNVAPFSAYKPTHNSQFLQLLWRAGWSFETSAFKLFMVAN